MLAEDVSVADVCVEDVSVESGTGERASEVTIAIDCVENCTVSLWSEYSSEMQSADTKARNRSEEAKSSDSLLEISMAIPSKRFGDFDVFDTTLDLVFIAANCGDDVEDDDDDDVADKISLFGLSVRIYLASAK